jgi:hypothetical protein
MLNSFRRLFGTRRLFKHRSPRKHRPTLEALEVRILPVVVDWINPSGGDWDTPANWSTHALPGATDDVVINLPKITVTHATGATEPEKGNRKRPEKSAMLKWGNPESTDGVRHRPITAS